MTSRKTLSIPATQAPAIGSTVTRPRMLGAAGATRGEITGVDGGYVTITWADGRKSVCPAGITSAPGWKVAA